jgi:hypothetical protein
VHGGRRTAAAVLAVVVAMVGIAVVLTRPHSSKDGTDTLRVLDSLPSDAASPTPSDPATAEPTDASTPSPSKTPTPAATSPAADASGSGTSAGSGNQVMSDLGPVPPGSVVYGYESGRHAWSGTSHGIAIDVSMSPAEPRAGQTVTFDVHTSAAAHCCYAYMVFGNGRGTPDVHCMQGPTGTAYDAEYSTVYNQAGRYEFLAGAMSGTSCGEQGDIYAWIDIAPGSSTGQGPELPVVQVDNSTPPPKHQDDPAWVTLWGEAKDADGFITKLVVDWGDGTTQTFPGDPGPCQKTSDGWPAATDVMVPYDPPPPHHYTSYGTFRVTLTAVSTACNGSDVQRGHASMSWDNPAPPKPSPSPSPTASPSTTP